MNIWPLIYLVFLMLLLSIVAVFITIQISQIVTEVIQQVNLFKDKKILQHSNQLYPVVKILVRNHIYDKAFDCYQMILDHESSVGSGSENISEAYNQMGNVYSHFKLSHLARSNYNLSLTYREDNCNTILNLARLLEKEKNYTGAIKEYKKALLFMPDHQDLSNRINKLSNLE